MILGFMLYLNVNATFILYSSDYQNFLTSFPSHVVTWLVRFLKAKKKKKCAGAILSREKELLCPFMQF